MDIFPGLPSGRSHPETRGLYLSEPQFPSLYNGHNTSSKGMRGSDFLIQLLLIQHTTVCPEPFEGQTPGE